MNKRLLGTALLSFLLGAAACFLVSTHTDWLHFLAKGTRFHSVDTNQVPWTEGGEGGPAKYYLKYLNKDPNTREVTMLLRYPAGQMMPPHTHSHGHGMYVISGKLVTQEGVFGPGTYLWFPPNQVVSHGATPEEDAVVLFMRHQDMDIKFVHAPAQ